MKYEKYDKRSNKEIFPHKLLKSQRQQAEGHWFNFGGRQHNRRQTE